MKKNVRNLFKKVKLLVLDVDGVLTRGEIIYDDKAGELKVFNVKDGLGIHILGRLGIRTVLLTARNSVVLKKRALDMRAAEVIGGILPKEKALSYLLKKYKIKATEICFVGDDLIDLGIMKKVGLSVAVADAVNMVKKQADFVSAKKGGEGAVREIIDLIIESKGLENKIEEVLNSLSRKS
ncbi:MAG: HAD-IIIA family hydrolase [Candidatus Omnitrophica bacterium]|nr:HAD-IIIA family hydrolase [Candidatus Omnitrophota bacterium]